MQIVSRSIVLATAVIVLVFAGCSRERPAHEKRILIQVEPPKKHEIVHHGAVQNVYALDGRTIIEKHIPDADGVTAAIYYRLDGTVRKTVEEYAPDPVSGKRQQKSSADWSEDGKTIVQGQQYRPDGSLRLQIRTLPDGKVETGFFLKGGWRFIQKIAAPGAQTWQNNYFRKDGTLWMKEAVTNTGMNVSSIEMYRADGITPHYRAEYSDNNGPPDVESMGHSESSERLVTYFNSIGKPSYRQRWKDQGRGNSMEAGYTLFEVEALSADGKVELTFGFEENMQEDIVRLKELKTQQGMKAAFDPYFGEPEKVPVQKWFNGQMNQESERTLEVGSLTRVVDSKGEELEGAAIKQHLDTSRLAAMVKRPLEPEFEERALEMINEDLSYLGRRDDGNPAKWYHTLPIF